jgi:WD40 repeat protein
MHARAAAAIIGQDSARRQFVSKPDGQLVQQILKSDAARAWLQQLTACFFDRDAKQELLDKVRTNLPPLAPGLNEEETAELAAGVIQELCRQASRLAMSPPSPGASPVRSGSELEDEIVQHYPYPVAAAYLALTEQANAAAGFGCLLDTFEALVHYLGAVAVSAYLRTGLTSAAGNRFLLELLLKRAWSTGDLYALLRETVRHAGACEGLLPYPLPALLFATSGKPTPSAQVLESFLSLRNRRWGHGTGRTEESFADILPPNRQRLEQALGQMPWLAEWQLIRPVVIEGNRVTKADLLNGSRRRQNRPFDLTLQERDLAHEGGDIRADRNALLLVAPDGRSYLPLFPLSLFRLCPGQPGHSTYFLQQLGWKTEAVPWRLARANYVSYASGAGDHEEGPREFVASSLEAHIARLRATLPEAVAPVAVEEGPACDPDRTLPEVLAEQQSHLRTFVGREAELQRAAAWIDAKGKGGYLLLLGPPGQGKSALMAELARREAEHGGCLLHMVKSHHNPLRFVPALISQAAQQAQTSFGPDSYAGDIDDLRNAWLKALQAVRDKAGRAIVVLDALDELELSRGRVNFLPAALPDGVRIVLTCRPDLPLVNALRARLSGCLEEHTLAPLCEGDFLIYLNKRLGASRVEEVEHAIGIGELFHRLGGNPLFLRCFADDVAASSPAGQPLTIDWSRLPASLDAVFHNIYDRVRERQDGRPVPESGKERALLLQLLCVARGPVGLEELAGLAKAAGRTLLLDDCRDRLEEMSQWLLDCGSGRFKPWHQGLADHVRSQVLGEAGQQHIEEVFCRWQEAEPNSWYALRHRIAHLLTCGWHDQACALLTDIEYLETKAEAGLVVELAGDFSAVAAALPPRHQYMHLLKRLEEALRRDLHFLTRHPSCIFQCLWNSGWWSDCARAEEFYLPPAEGWPAEGPPWKQPGPKLCQLVESWREAKEKRTPGFVWLRALRPPPMPLGTAQRALFTGHTGPVLCVAFAPNGKLLASGSHDRTVRLWDTQRGAEAACLTGHQHVVLSVAFSTDSRWLASSSVDGSVRLWDIESCTEHSRLRPGTAVHGIAFTPDGRQLILGGRDHAIHVWDLTSGRRQHKLRGHGERIMAVAASPDGLQIASASRDNTVQLWDRESNKVLAILTGHDHPVSSVAFSPDGARLISGSRDGMVRVWDARSGAPLLTIHGHEHTSSSIKPEHAATGVTGVGFTADGTELVSAGEDRTVRFWDSATGTAHLCLRGGHTDRIQAIAVGPHGDSVATASWDGTVCLWNVGGGSGAWAPLRGVHDLIVRVAISPDGRRLASASQDGNITLWDATSCRDTACLRGHDKAVWSVTWSPDGTRLVSASWDHTVRIWDAATEEVIACLRGHEHRVRYAVFSPDGARVASAADDKTARVWDAATGAELTCFRGHKDPVAVVAFSPDGRLVASGSDDRTIRIWDSATGTEVVCLRGHTKRVLRLAFSPDGARLVSGARDQTLRTWDIGSGLYLAVAAGAGDVAAIAAGSSAYPWLALLQPLETVIQSAATKRPVAWLANMVFGLVTHPDGRTWAGVSGPHLYVFTLEGKAH